MIRTICGVVVAGTLLCAPAGLHAQSATGAAHDAQGSSSPQADAWLEEARVLQQRMQPLQQQAMQDTALRRMQREATSELERAMRQHDPEILDKLARMGAILEEAAVARAANDQETLAALAEEAGELQPVLAAAQQAALNDGEVLRRLTAFQSQLHARMVALDPSAAQAIERLAQLEQNLRGVQLEPRI